MKRIVVASDSFKGTLSSSEICDIAKRVIPEYFPECEVFAVPVADGGEGTVDCFLKMGAEPVCVKVSGPFFDKTDAVYARLGDTAVIEMSAAAGLPLAGDRKDPEKTTTYGVGEMIRDAVEKGCRKVLLGLGGSATNDCGCGMAAALGTEFFDKSGKSFIPTGATLKDIDTIVFNKTDADITVLCDVRNPLYGKDGAAYVYAPQKGAGEEEVRKLDEGLRHIACVLEMNGKDVAGISGAGAAGGMGAGLLAFTGAKLRRGIEVVLDLAGFEKAAQNADFIITGEGSLDSQSFSGKVIDGIISRSAGKPVIATVGISKLDDCRKYGLTAVFESNDRHLPFEQVAGRAEEDYRICCKKAAQFIKEYK
jgi:glycerate kinase